jgi:biopolymer transport protein ExbD
MSGGGSSEENLNLTPFIDLFSVLVIFLISTAVWQQLSSLSTNIENSTSSDNPVPKEKEVSLSITLLADKVQLLESEKTTDIPYLPTQEIDRERLKSSVETWRTRFPDKKDVTLNTANTVAYGKMIAVFDIVVGAGFPNVGVNTQ